jgi:hypothetical protein
MSVLQILVAGPYRSGTNDDPALIRQNVDAMTDASLRLFRAGHLPVMGEWYALPLIEHGGSTGIGDPVFTEIFGGPSVGADEMVALARSNGKAVWHSIDDIPPAV